jgi:hypothetical protein
MTIRPAMLSQGKRLGDRFGVDSVMANALASVV